MRVLQIIETGGPGGAETVFAQLSTALRDEGHSVHCLVAEGSWLPQELRRRGFSPVVLEANTSALGFVTRILSIIRQERVEIVHAHLFDGAVFAAIAANMANIPIVATLHGQVDIRRDKVKHRIKHWLFRTLVNKAVAVSDALRRDLAPTLRLPAERFAVVHNGMERAAAVDAPSQVVRAIHRLVAVGNIRPAKDYPMLLKAVRLLRDEGLELTLDVLGQPDSNGLFEALIEQRRDLRLESTVAFHGFVSDPLPYLSGASAFVLASSQEGFSLATIEAMLAQVPVVATRSGGPEEIIDHGRTGVLVPPSDPQALATAIALLLNDDTRRKRLAEAALLEVTKRFSVSQMVTAYIALYRGCVYPEAAT